MQNNVGSSHNNKTKIVKEKNNEKLEGSSAIMNETENGCNNAAKNEKYKKYMVEYLYSIIAELLNILTQESKFYLIVLGFSDMDEETNQKIIKSFRIFGTEFTTIIENLHSILPELVEEVIKNKKERNPKKTKKLINILVELPDKLKGIMDNFLKTIEKDDVNHIISIPDFKDKLYSTLNFFQLKLMDIFEIINDLL